MDGYYRAGCLGDHCSIIRSEDDFTDSRTYLEADYHFVNLVFYGEADKIAARATPSNEEVNLVGDVFLIKPGLQVIQSGLHAFTFPTSPSLLREWPTIELMIYNLALKALACLMATAITSFEVK